MPRPFAWILCAAGAALVLVGLVQSRLGSETRSYTRTRGRILAAEVDEIPAPSEQGGPRYRPVVRYSYEVRGRTYESERVTVASGPGETSDEQGARREVGRHPAGAEVDVWYDARDPRRSVLVRGVPRGQVVAAVVLGLALLGVGMLGLAR